MCMIDQCDPATVWRQKFLKARVEHQCSECKRTIRKGEHYQRVNCLYEGSWDRFKTCRHCLAVSEWLNLVCGGWLSLGLREELREHWDEDYDYRTMWLGRAIVGIERGWNGMEPLPSPLTSLLETVGVEGMTSKYGIIDHLERTDQRAAASA